MNKEHLTPQELRGRNVLYVGIGISVAIAIAAIVLTTTITDEGILNMMDFRYVAGFAIFGCILPLSMEIRERIIDRYTKKIWCWRIAAISFLTLAGTLAIILIPTTWTDLICLFLGFALTYWCAHPSKKEPAKEA